MYAIPDQFEVGCRNDSSITDPLSNRLGALAGTSSAQDAFGRPITPLRQTFNNIADEAPNAKIYVAGYPKLFGSGESTFDANSSAPSGKVCQLSLGINVEYDDAQWMNAKVVELNSIISTAVDEARSDGVDVRYVTSALFTGHGLCDTFESWITPVILSGPEDGWPPSVWPESQRVRHPGMVLRSTRS